MLTMGRLPVHPTVVHDVQEEMKQWVGRSDTVKELESFILEPSKPLPLIWFISGPHGTGKTDVSKAIASLAYGLGYMPTEKHNIIPADWITNVDDMAETMDHYRNETLMIDDDENVLEMIAQDLIPLAKERGISLHIVSLHMVPIQGENGTDGVGIMHLTALSPADLVVILHRHLNRILPGSTMPDTTTSGSSTGNGLEKRLSEPTSQAPNNASDMVHFAQYLAKQLTTIWSGTEDLVMTDSELVGSWIMYLDEAYGFVVV
jgi:hypothetical protein